MEAALRWNLCLALGGSSCPRSQGQFSVEGFAGASSSNAPSAMTFWLQTIWTSSEDPRERSHGLIPTATLAAFLPPLPLLLPPPPPLLLFASLHLVLLWRWKMQREINHPPCHLISNEKTRSIDAGRAHNQKLTGRTGAVGDVEVAAGSGYAAAFPNEAIVPKASMKRRRRTITE